MLPTIRNAAIATLTLGLTLASATAATFISPVPTVNPADAFITAIYRDLLGRPVDAAGLNFWRSYLKSGGSRTAMASQILASGEARNRLVQSLYQSYLGRTPTPAESSALIGLLNTGVNSTQGHTVVLGSIEYYDRRGLGTVDGFIGALYKDILGRPAGGSEVTMWSALVASQGRNAVATAILDSSEGRMVRIRGWYLRYLGRPAANAEITYYLQLMNLGATDETLVAMILGSVEYYERVRSLESGVRS
jgi:hypothetical protein